MTLSDIDRLMEAIREATDVFCGEWDCESCPAGEDDCECRFLPIYRGLSDLRRREKRKSDASMVFPPMGKRESEETASRDDENA